MRYDVSPLPVLSHLTLPPSIIRISEYLEEFGKCLFHKQKANVPNSPAHSPPVPGPMNRHPNSPP